MTIPFRIRQIKTQQFAMFPDKLEGKDVKIESEFNFGVNKDLSAIRCITKISYTQGDNLILMIEVHCFFEISKDASHTIAGQGKIEVGFLRYLATISTGTVRGIIHNKTEGTSLNPIILPPLNLVEVIKEDLVFKVEN